MFQDLFIHSSVDGLLGYFHILAIGNAAAINMGKQFSFQYTDFTFFGFLPSSRMACSYASSISSFLRHLHTIFQSS
jgi:hypothetical protein